MSSISLRAIFCEDIRRELSDQLTIVGMYQEQLQTPGFPFTLDRLRVLVTLASDELAHIAGATIEAYAGDEKVSTFIAPPIPDDIATDHRAPAKRVRCKLVTVLIIDGRQITESVQLKLKAILPSGETIVGEDSLLITADTMETVTI